MLSELLGENITKRNFKSVIGRLYRQQQNLDTDVPNNRISQTTQSNNDQLSSSTNQKKNALVDWEDAPDSSSFLGRKDEIVHIQSWIIDDRCRLVGIFGIGGIGKTTLAVKLAQLAQHDFEYVVWRSLRNAPPLDELLIHTIEFVSDRRDTEQCLPLETGGRIRHLMQYFKNQRCLLILDNAEAILQSGDRCGRYRCRYEDYGEFLRQVGEQRHQSCLLLTSREKPHEYTYFDGEQLPVRSLQLTGLSESTGQAIIEKKGNFSATPQIWQRLVNLYAGNPLALKIVAAAIRELFEGQIEEFLENAIFIFDDITHLLDEQFNRLSRLEQKVMYWLAIEREPVSLETLQTDILQSLSKRELFESLKSLIRRSLIQKTAKGFTQQPVIMEYLIEKLREQVTQEIISDTPNILVDYALLKTQTKEYIRAYQQRVVIKPITEQLLECCGSLLELENKLRKLVTLLREQWSEDAGYATGNIIHLAKQLEIDLSGYDFSNLPLRQVDLQMTMLKRANLQGASLNDVTFSDNLDYFFSIAIDPQGKLVATGGAQGKITLRDFPSLNIQYHLSGHGSWVNQVAFSPDSQILASASLEATVRIWDLSTQNCIAVLCDHTAPVSSVTFSPDGQTLVTGGHDGLIKFWDVKHWNCFKTIEEPTGQVGGVAFSPDGNLLAYGSFDGYGVLYDLRTEQQRRSKDSHGHLIWFTVFHPNGKSFITSSWDHNLREWDIHTGECLKIFRGHTNHVAGVVCSSDGKLLASGSHDQTVRIWNLDTGECLQVLQGHLSDVWGVAFSPDHQILASVSMDHSTRLWEVETGKPLKVSRGSYTALWSIAFNADGTQLISGGEDRKFRLWNLATQQCVNTWSAHDNEITCVRFHPQGKIVASGGGDRTIKLWDLQSGRCLHQLKGHQNWVWSIAFSPNGQFLASAGRDKLVYIRDAKTGELLQILEENIKVFNWSVAFNHNSQILASGNYDCLINLWNTTTWEKSQTLVGHESYINAVSFNPKNNLLVSGGFDCSVRLWDTEMGECIKVLREHQDMIWSIDFNPSGDLVASASFDQTIKIWDVRTGDCLHTLSGHKGFVFSVSFHPRENVIASGSRDGTIRLWDINSGECLSILQPPQIYEELNIKGVQGLSPMEREMLLSLGAVED